MPLSSIVTIVIRLFALNWIVGGIITFASLVREITRYWSTSPNYWGLLYPAVMLAIGVLFFMWSQLVARIVTPRSNPEVNLGGLTQYDLYCFAFTFLGLYFVLSSIAETLNWLHYSFLVVRDTHEGNPQRADSFYQLTRPLITLLAGGASLMFAPRFARKLTSVQLKNDKI